MLFSFVYIEGEIWSDEIEISVTKIVTISLRFLSFVTISLRILIRFIRPSFAPVFSLFVYIDGEIWSDETDWKIEISVTKIVTICSSFPNLLRIHHCS